MAQVSIALDWRLGKTVNWLDSYLVLDIIGDLAFGAPFGVLEKASEDVKICISHDKIPSLPVITSLTTRS